MSQTTDFNSLERSLLAMARDRNRHFLAIVGAPGSGKSTLAQALFEALEAQLPGRSAILPMDGFHFDDMLLRERGDLPRKGAPHTFDVGGLQAILGRLAAGDAPVAVPVFDRDLEIARAGARIIAPEARLILVEGNYLLLDDPDWAVLRPHFDKSVFLDVPFETLRARLLTRWSSYPPEEAERKISENDLPNARRVVEGSVPADLVLTDWQPPQGGAA